MTLSLTALVARLRPSAGTQSLPGLGTIAARLKGTAPAEAEDGTAARRLAAMAAAERAREGRRPARPLLHGIA